MLIFKNAALALLLLFAFVAGVARADHVSTVAPLTIYGVSVSR